jgi:hypothetical protein
MNICLPQVITSSDGTPYFERGPNTISGFSATPTPGSQISVSIGGSTAVVFPAGVGWNNDTRNGSMIGQTVRINVVAGTVVFTSNN